MKRKHKIEFTIVSIVILALTAVLVYQFRFNRKFLYEQAKVLYKQGRYDEAISRYVKFLKRYKEGKYVKEARRELFCRTLPHNPEALSAIEASVKSEAVESLIDALGDKEWSLRTEAALALGDIGDSRAVAPLIAALEDDYVRTEAIIALGDIKNTRAVESLIAVLKDNDPVHRMLTAFALGEIGDTRAVAPLITALRDEDYMVQESAAEALGAMKDPRAAESLAAELRNELIRQTVVGALAALGKQAVEPLDAQVKGDDATVHVWAAATLYELDHEKDKQVERLTAALKNEEWSVRREAARTLKLIKDPLAVKSLISALEDEKPEVRQITALALGKLRDSRAVEPLIAALVDKDRGVRSEAARSLGNIGDTRAVDPLIAGLKKQDDLGVILDIVDALRRIGDARATVPLIAVLKEKSHLVRIEAAKALGELGDTRAIAPLVAALGDDHEDVKVWAAAALYQLDHERDKQMERLIAALKEELDERKQEVREALAAGLLMPCWPAEVTSSQALRWITGNDFGSDQKQWEQWWDQNINTPEPNNEQ